MITKIKQVIKERWKFYLIGYVIGYLIPIINDRQVNIYYLFPFKLMGVACALGIGTALYYGSKKMPVFETFYRSVTIKHCTHLTEFRKMTFLMFHSERAVALLKYIELPHPPYSKPYTTS